MPSTKGHGSKKRAILYARVSSRKQVEEGFSLQQQLDALRDHAKGKGYEIVAEVEEAGVSGTKYDRPGLNRVLDLVEAGGIDVVLAQDRDRITRDSTIAGYLEIKFEQCGCALRTLDDPEDESPSNKLVRNMLYAIAEFERELMLIRTKRGSRQRAKEGQVLGSGTPPYGFKRNPEGTNFEVDEITMQIVCRIVQMVADGSNIHQVKATLETENVPPPGNNKREGQRWYPMTIRRMILSDAYKGTWWYGRKGDDAIPVAIPDSGISHETIDAARAAISNNRKVRSNARRYYELRGIAYCGGCGLKMTPYSTKNRLGKEYRYYRCQKATKYGKDACTGKPRAADKLEFQVAWYVTELINDPARLQAQIDAAIAQESTRNPDVDVEEWVKVLAQCERDRGKYQQMFVADAVTIDELKHHLHELDERKATAEEHLANARAGQSRVEELRATKRAMLEAYAQGISYDGVYWLPPVLKHEIYYALRLKVTAHEDSLQYDTHVNPTVIKLTRAVEEYGHEVEQYRGLLRSSSITDSDLREIENIMQGAVMVGGPSPEGV
jgi:site-specific DNA recombinase